MLLPWVLFLLWGFFRLIENCCKKKAVALPPPPEEQAIPLVIIVPDEPTEKQDVIVLEKEEKKTFFASLKSIGLSVAKWTSQWILNPLSSLKYVIVINRLILAGYIARWGAQPSQLLGKYVDIGLLAAALIDAFFQIARKFYWKYRGIAFSTAYTSPVLEFLEVPVKWMLFITTFTSSPAAYLASLILGALLAPLLRLDPRGTEISHARPFALQGRPMVDDEALRKLRQEYPFEYKFQRFFHHLTYFIDRHAFLRVPLRSLQFIDHLVGSFVAINEYILFYGGQADAPASTLALVAIIASAIRAVISKILTLVEAKKLSAAVSLEEFFKTKIAKVLQAHTGITVFESAFWKISRALFYSVTVVNQHFGIKSDPEIFAVMCLLAVIISLNSAVQAVDNIQEGWMFKIREEGELPKAPIDDQTATKILIQYASQPRKSTFLLFAQLPETRQKEQKNTSSMRSPMKLTG